MTKPSEVVNAFAEMLVFVRTDRRIAPGTPFEIAIALACANSSGIVALSKIRLSYYQSQRYHSENNSYPLNGTPFRGEPVTLSLEFDEVIWPYFVTFPREPSFRDAFALMLKISSVGLQNTPAFC